MCAPAGPAVQASGVMGTHIPSASPRKKPRRRRSSPSRPCGRTIEPEAQEVSERGVASSTAVGGLRSRARRARVDELVAVRPRVGARNDGDVDRTSHRYAIIRVVPVGSGCGPSEGNFSSFGPPGGSESASGRRGPPTRSLTRRNACKMCVFIRSRSDGAAPPRESSDRTSSRARPDHRPHATDSSQALPDEHGYETE